MATIRKNTIHLIFLFALLQFNFSSFAQQKELDPKKWAVDLDKKDFGTVKNSGDYFKEMPLLENLDSIRAFQFLDQLEAEGRSKGDYFKARFNCIKARQLTFRNVYQAKGPYKTTEAKEQIKKLLAEAIELAYRSEDNRLIAFVSSIYSSTIFSIGETGLSVMYGMNGIELREKLMLTVPPMDYQFLAELFYRVREYDNCIKYAGKAAEAWRNDPHEDKVFRVSCINTIALGYHRQKKYDSAFAFYNEALQLARETNNKVWIGIVSGNIGQIYYAQQRYDTARALLKTDYETSKAEGYYDNAANSLQWVAKIDLALGKKSNALSEVREAFQLLKLWPDAGYLRNTYFTTTQIFRELGSYDSAFYYNNLYVALNDSLEKVVNTSSVDISKARLNDEASRYRIQNLNKEKKSELMMRNIVIASIIIFSIIALLILNRKRLKQKIKTEKAELEKLRMEQEVASASEQLKMFTENIIEKTNLIERLELELKGKEASSEQQSIITTLSEQTILTEEDWLKFKTLFEKIHPGFFIKLKENFPDITLAEQRMAALIRLHLTTKQIASMLGISLDSVHKSRQRLRHRLNVDANITLEESVAVF